MYKTKVWDEDKWNIHSSSYSPSKNEGISADNKYHEQKYGKEKNIPSDYMRREDEMEKEESKNQIFDDLWGGDSKKQEVKEDEIPFEAAKQIFDEKRHEAKTIEKKKDVKTIEEAIKKAIEEEKKVIVID